MDRAEEILKVTVDAAKFGQRGKRALTATTQRRIEKAASELEKLAQSGNPIELPPSEDIKAILVRFLKAARDGKDAAYSAFDGRRRAAKLAWALYHPIDGRALAQNRPLLMLALRTIDRRFRAGIIPAILTAVLRSWGDRTVDTRILRRYLAKKAAAYSGRRRALLNIRDNLDLFTKRNGPMTLATRFFTNGDRLTEVCSYLGLGEEMISYAYFGDVGVAFAELARREQRIEEHAPDLLAFLARMKDLAVTKKILSKIVPPLKDTAAPATRQRLRRAAMAQVGDPAQKSKWQPWEGASSKEQDDLESARVLLNMWIAENLVEQFFRHISIDEAREQFWLKYVPYMPNVKIYTDSWTRSKMISDPMLAPYRERIGTLTGGGSQSALVIETRDHVLVEFSHIGAAFYAYHKDNSHSPKLEAQYQQMRRLRNPSAVPGKIYEFAREGRVFHLGWWKSTLENWLNNHVIE